MNYWLYITGLRMCEEKRLKGENDRKIAKAKTEDTEEQKEQKYNNWIQNNYNPFLSYYSNKNNNKEEDEKKNIKK
jgi:hypothetical protein